MRKMFLKLYIVMFSYPIISIFEFKVIILDWLLTKAREPSPLYYFSHRLVK